jgi:uncharacterized protein YndB with AHSA1/START domain
MSPEQETPTTRAIEVSATVNAPPDRVWRVLTDPEELARWFPLRSGGTPGPGGKVLLSWGEEMEWWTNITAWEPGSHLQWMDTAIPGAPPPLIMDWYITTEKGKTVVRGVHSGFGSGAEWDAMYDALEGGWSFFMRNLRHYVDRHLGKARDMVFTRRKTSLSQAEVWDRLTSEDGLAIEGDLMRFAGARGRVEHAAPKEYLWGTFAALDDSLLFVEFEGRAAPFTLGLWLSTYGLEKGKVVELQEEMNAMVGRVLTE